MKFFILSGGKIRQLALTGLFWRYGLPAVSLSNPRVVRTGIGPHGGGPSNFTGHLLAHLVVFLAGLGLAASALAATLPELLKERLPSVVAVQFIIQTEIDRRPNTVLGTVIDDQGTIILPGSAIAPDIAADQLRDFKVFPADSSDEYAAEYLGQDAYTGWHFVRVESRLRPLLVPVTRFAVTGTPEPQLDDEVWGIGLRNRDEDFMPYVLSSRIALITRLPNKTAITAQEVAGPGLPVFDRAGRFVGLTQNSFGQNFLMFSRGQNGTPVLLVNVEESSVVLLASEVRPNLGRIPAKPDGRPIAWIGIYGLQPVDPEVAKLLHLEMQSGVVLSDIMEGGPAAQAGLQDRDIVLALDGKAFPRLKPDRAVVGFFGQEILRHRPGEVLTLTVLRGSEHREVRVTLGDEPKMVREASRRYFDQFGFTIREFLALDTIVNRTRATERGGVVVHFVKPNGPGAIAGLRPDDWIREIDGQEIHTYAEAVERLALLETDKTRSEFVLLTSRGGETQVLHIKLK
ncbi:MAG: PDZ domain-containing protein [Opitutales bacterium]